MHYELNFVLILAYFK